MTGRRTTVGWNPPLTALAVCLALGCGIAATPAQESSAALEFTVSGDVQHLVDPPLRTGRAMIDAGSVRLVAASMAQLDNGGAGNLLLVLNDVFAEVRHRKGQWPAGLRMHAESLALTVNAKTAIVRRAEVRNVRIGCAPSSVCHEVFLCMDPRQAIAHMPSISVRMLKTDAPNSIEGFEPLRYLASAAVPHIWLPPASSPGNAMTSNLHEFPELTELGQLDLEISIDAASGIQEAKGIVSKDGLIVSGFALRNSDLGLTGRLLGGTSERSDIPALGQAAPLPLVKLALLFMLPDLDVRLGAMIESEPEGPESASRETAPNDEHTVFLRQAGGNETNGDHCPAVGASASEHAG